MLQGTTYEGFRSPIALPLSGCRFFRHEGGSQPIWTTGVTPLRTRMRAFLLLFDRPSPVTQQRLHNCFTTASLLLHRQIMEIKK